MLTTDEELRYSRQLMLADIGPQGQQRLANASVLIVGLGGLGSPAALYLAAAGIGRLVLADGDQLDVTNLQRQVLYATDDIGQNKADSARERLLALNPEIDIETVDEHLDEEALVYWIDDVDLVLDCTDNLNTRHLINRTCVTLGKPLVTGAAIRFEGQLLLVDSRGGSPCYHCIVPEGTRLPAGSCQTAGVIGPLLGIIGSMQALEAIKYLTGIPSGLAGKMKLFDARTLEWQSIQVKVNPGCEVCGA